MKLFFCKMLIMFCLFVSQFSMSAEVIKHIDATSAKSQYHIDLLKFLFEGDSNFTFEQGDPLVSRPRQISDIKEGITHVGAFGTSEKLEKELLPIRIPILKGLLGHRIFIINKDDQQRFSSIQSLSKLKSLRLGQGRGWADTQILKSEGFNVVTTLKYPNLFPMLEGGRFDYFPRAVFEPFDEVSRYPELELTVEEDLMIVYPLPQYLFVSNDNQKLADAIINKFEEKIADGSFTDFLLNHPMVSNAIIQSDIKNRRIFKIENPFLTKETPLERPELWMSVDEI